MADSRRENIAAATTAISNTKLYTNGNRSARRVNRMEKKTEKNRVYNIHCVQRQSRKERERDRELATLTGFCVPPDVNICISFSRLSLSVSFIAHRCAAAYSGGGGLCAYYNTHKNNV